MHFCIRLKAATNERTEASVHRIEIKLKKPESSLNRFRVKATDAFHNLQNHRKLVVSMPRLSAPSCHSRLFFIYFRLFNTVDSKQMFDKSLPMTGFEPWISGVAGHHSTNWATTTTLLYRSIYLSLHNTRRQWEKIDKTQLHILIWRFHLQLVSMKISSFTYKILL